jgi:hypothetical protein
MTLARAFILTRPWGLYTAHLSPPARLPVKVGDRVSVLAGCGLSVVGPRELMFKFSGQKIIPAQREGGIFAFGGTEKAYCTIPASSTSRESDFKLVISRDQIEEIVEVSVEGALARPQKPGDVTPAEHQLTFLLSIVERLRALSEAEGDEEALDYHVNGRRMIATCIPWERLVEQWYVEREGDDPRMDIIVRHAATLQSVVEGLASHPRLVLKRIRERQPVSRIQELDAACLQWFVRQPGRTAAEKAGSRQTILAVARQGTFDTLENRVLHDYLARAAVAATSYVSLHRALRRTARVASVERYARLCRQLGHGLTEDGVGFPTPPVVPNYVLQQDARYRQVWKAYQELLRRETEVDDVWRWQVRLWAEFCRLSILVALRSSPGVRVLAEAPLWLKTDQSRGRWADTTAHPAVLLIEGAEWNGRVVITFIDGQDKNADGFGRRELWRYFWSVGPAAVIHSQEIATGREAWVLVWTLHAVGANVIDLAREAGSADVALRQLKEQIGLGLGIHVNLGGFVIASNPFPSPLPPSTSSGEVVACATALGEASLHNMIAEIADLLPVIIGLAGHA